MRMKRGSGEIGVELKKCLKDPPRSVQTSSEQSLMPGIYMQQGETPVGDEATGKREVFICMTS